jgi:hypothetical protein
LQQADKNEELIFFIRDELKDIISAEITISNRGAPGSGDKRFKQMTVKTTVHADLTKLYNVFHPSISLGGPCIAPTAKLIPAVSVLLQYLSYLGLACLIMQDGSIKSDQSKGMEIHTQCFSYEMEIHTQCFSYEKYIHSVFLMNQSPAWQLL